MKRRRYVTVPMKRKRRTTAVRKRRSGRPRVITMKRLLGRGISRPYKDNNRLMLGSGNKTSKQRGGFFPLAAALTAASAVIDLLGKIIR